MSSPLALMRALVMTLVVLRRVRNCLSIIIIIIMAHKSDALLSITALQVFELARVSIQLASIAGSITRKGFTLNN